MNSSGDAGTKGESEDDMRAWLARQRDLKSVRAVVCDLNGIYRGKRLPIQLVDKAIDGTLKMPLSTLLVDVWGDDALGTGQVLETGDRDGFLHPTGRGFLAMDWLGAPSALLPCSMYTDEGEPYAGDPRHVLAAVVERYRARGLTPVCATELEFYLHARDATRIRPPTRPDGVPLSANAVYSLQDLDGFDSFLEDVYAASRKFGIEAEEAISENGCGQFEINFRHVADPLRAADDAQFFKYLVKGVAGKHGFGATFMAKPYGKESGSGFHVHYSLLDADGRNVFDDGTDEGSELFRHAIGGLLHALPASMLVFAPHYNSYRRLRTGTHAPIRVDWGYENRTAAIRVPSGDGASRRIEHRVSGADANPYLVLAAILGAALIGMDEQIDPGAPLEGNSEDGDAPWLPFTWEQAIDVFELSPLVPRMLGEFVPPIYAAVKQQEADEFAEELSPFEIETYLRVL